MTPEPDPRAALDAAGQIPDAELDLAGVALQFARIDAPDADWRAVAAHLSDIARQAVSAAELLTEEDCATRRAALAAVLHDGIGYQGDAESYDDLANANLIRVVERRRGLPVALGILWLHAAEAAGWPAHGVDFPGHFLIALETGRRLCVVDVFDRGAAMEAPALRALIKRFEGPAAELRPGLLRAMGKREVLLRLQNNIKLRRLRAGQLAEALACAEDMLRLAPGHGALWREAGLMNHRLERHGAALACLERALEIEPVGEGAMRLRALAEELRQRLN